LFFTDEEIKAIHDHLSSHSLEKPPLMETLSLSAIIYIDANHWTLWINNTILRSYSSRDIAGFHIEDVRPDRVTFSWRPQGATISLTFTLLPHQTYRVKEQRIIEEGTR
jgi:hypothetical protein